MQFVLVIVTNLNLASVTFYAHCLIFYAQFYCICILRYPACLSPVSFLMKGRTTLHKGHQKPKGSALFGRLVSALLRSPLDNNNNNNNCFHQLLSVYGRFQFVR